MPGLMYLRGLRVTKNACLSLLTHTKKPLIVTFCDTTAGIGNWMGQDTDAAVWMDRREG